jgi:asparagine synthase (glutamine-hydrolysing)
MAGYPRYLGAWMAESYARVPAIWRERMRQAVDATLGSGQAYGSALGWATRFLAQGARSPERMFYAWSGYLDEGQKDELFARRQARHHEDFSLFRELREDHRAEPLHDVASRIDLESFLPHNVLAYGDRMSMAHSLEVRVPFCDHLLVERMAEVPLATKMPGGMQKGLFRWAMRKRLPRSVLLHKKVGFNPPLAEWLRKDLEGLMADHLSDATCAAVACSDLPPYANCVRALRGAMPSLRIRCGRWWCWRNGRVGWMLHLRRLGVRNARFPRTRRLAMLRLAKARSRR